MTKGAAQPAHRISSRHHRQAIYSQSRPMGVSLICLRTRPATTQNILPWTVFERRGQLRRERSMARVEMTPEHPEDPVLSGIFDLARAKGGEVPNLYRVLGASPDMLKAWIDFAWSLRLDAKTPRGLRELIIMRGAQLSGVAYEWAHHWPMAVKAGVDEAKLHALESWPESDLFTDEERAVLQMADEITNGPGATEATIEGLKALFTPSEIVELSLTASFYVCVSRLLTSLEVDVEPGYASLAEAFENR